MSAQKFHVIAPLISALCFSVMARFFKSFKHTLEPFFALFPSHYSQQLSSTFNLSIDWLDVRLILWCWNIMRSINQAVTRACVCEKWSLYIPSFFNSTDFSKLGPVDARSVYSLGPTDLQEAEVAHGLRMRSQKLWGACPLSHTQRYFGGKGLADESGSGGLRLQPECDTRIAVNLQKPAS